jgi:hypothetical protein
LFSLLLTHNFNGPSSSLGPSDPLSQKLLNGRNFGNVTQKVGLKSGFTIFFTAGPYHEDIFQKKKIVSALGFERFYPELTFFEGKLIIISMRKLNCR